MRLNRARPYLSDSTAAEHTDSSDSERCLHVSPASPHVKLWDECSSRSRLTSAAGSDSLSGEVRTQSPKRRAAGAR
jgi:hypothetical protein